jgi:diguanylate cyclase (GGDEF)-like protein
MSLSPARRHMRNSPLPPATDRAVLAAAGALSLAALAGLIGLAIRLVSAGLPPTAILALALVPALPALPAYLAWRTARLQGHVEIAGDSGLPAASDAHLATIEALALAIEARDGTSHTDLQRFRSYADGLGGALGMSAPDMAALRTAALLHDIGNLAVPEHILSKQSRLTHEEFEKVKIHPRVGEAIVRSVPFPYAVSPLILGHHERWDGRGYPLGLRGADIPLGARVLAVIDCFTSLLSDRPHRPARTFAEAIATIRENAGSALDPALVEAFVDVLPSLERRYQQRCAEAGPVPPAGALVDEPASPGALEDIAVAHHEDSVLREIAQALGSSLRVSDTVALISARLVSLVPFSALAVFMVDRVSGHFVCRYATGAQHEVLRTMTAPSVEALESWFRQGAAKAPDGAPGFHSTLLSPLVISNRTIGTLIVAHTSKGAYGADHSRLLARVAAQAAAVLANAVVFEETQEQSLTDVLTGLPNRRYMERHLSQYLARASRKLEPVAVLLLDMDRFKSINDEFGHQSGDRALQEVARVLRGSLRVYDVCARYAGDEFVIVMGNCDADLAEKRRLDLQDAVARIVFEPAPSKTARLEISAGAATYPVDGDTADELIGAADRRMYVDKATRDGRAPDPVFHSMESRAGQRA